jgi:uncharacterized protein YdeI (YjbR/CyaY-like superfamily)
MEAKTYSYDEVLKLLDNETYKKDMDNIYFVDENKNVFITKNYSNDIVINHKTKGFYIDIKRFLAHSATNKQREYILNAKYSKFLGSYPWIN